VTDAASDGSCARDVLRAVPLSAALPADPNPSWNGYSSGMGLDGTGNPMTDAARITERFRRINFGHMGIDITVDDPKAWTKP
jgi:hypothetical protein